MHKFVVTASLIVFAAVSTGCGDSSSRERAGSVLAPSEVAARGGGGKGGGSTGGGGGSIALRMVGDVNGDGLPNWGDQVTFDISTSATTQPHVDLTCRQNGTVVLGATSGFYDGYPWPWTRIMTLSSPSWQSGGADCTAVLYYFSGSRNTVVASTSFTAYP